MVGKGSGCLEIANLYGAQTQLHSPAWQRLLLSTFSCPKNAQLHVDYSKEAPFSFETGSIRTASQRTPDHRTSMTHGSSS